ncbi:MAG: hypothetical protein MHM6MM_009243, partial [Cercozoa sp. M6MM]
MRQLGVADATVQQELQLNKELSERLAKSGSAKTGTAASNNPVGGGTRQEQMRALAERQQQLQLRLKQSDMRVAEALERTQRGIVQRFAFASDLKRMCCVVHVDADQKGKGLFLCVAKGAAETMKHRFVDAPVEYDSQHQLYERRGARVLALGVRELTAKEVQQARRGELPREVAESELHFCGFLTLKSPLKAGTLETVRQLKESAHRVVMITGDHRLTACAVARRLCIVTRPVVTLLPDEDGTVSLVTEDAHGEEESCQVLSDVPQLVQWHESHDLCVTGTALDKLLDASSTASSDVSTVSELCVRVLRQARVFARVSPRHKETVLRVLKERCNL